MNMLIQTWHGTKDILLLYCSNDNFHKRSIFYSKEQKFTLGEKKKKKKMIWSHKGIIKIFKT